MIRAVHGERKTHAADVTIVELIAKDAATLTALLSDLYQGADTQSWVSSS